MIKVDLITGILGSGKTTFLKKYAKFLMDRGEKLCILENDFGAVNVDMMILGDLLGERCNLEMVAGGCDADCHKRRFKTKLISMGMFGYDRVLVEPSGIFDVDEFFDALREEPLEHWYEIGNVIAVVDAGLPENLSDEAEYLLASQAACAGSIVLSRVQEAEPVQIERAISHLNRSMERIRCARRFGAEEFVQKDWEQLSEEDFEKIAACGFVLEDFEKRPIMELNNFSALCFFQDNGEGGTIYSDTTSFLNLRVSENELRAKVKSLFAAPDCGRIFRVKGFFQIENRWMELNATAEALRLKPIREGQEVFIVIGEHLNEKAIKSVFQGQ